MEYSRLIMPYLTEYLTADADNNFLWVLKSHFSTDEIYAMCDIESRHSIKLIYLHRSFLSGPQSAEFFDQVNLIKKTFEDVDLQADYITDHYINRNSEVYDSQDEFEHEFEKCDYDSDD